ncbi:MAG: HAD family hydrolase [Anaerolineales bacterium]|nr:HAD family hydrolase [Anaerolineales bacterium]
MPLNPTKIKVICFDIDGTLADTDDAMVEKLAKIIPLPYPFFSSQSRLRAARKILMAIETPANQMLYYLDRFGLDDWFFRIQHKVISGKRRGETIWKPINGVIDTITTLSKHYAIAIISARDSHLTQSFISQLGLSTIIQCWASCETTLHSKPYPDPIKLVAQQLRVNPSECVMVGDTTADILAGKNAGAQAIGVLSGFGEERELWAAGADEVIADVNILLRLLPT